MQLKFHFLHHNNHNPTAQYPYIVAAIEVNDVDMAHVLCITAQSPLVILPKTIFLLMFSFFH